MSDGITDGEKAQKKYFEILRNYEWQEFTLP